MKKFSLKSHSTNSSPFWTFFSAIIAVNLMIFLSGCVSLPKSTEKSQKISRTIEGKGLLSSSELSSYFLSQNPSYDKKSIQNLSALYISEAKTEGINSDVAFAQMYLETGYLRFGNLVVPEMHNYCGLGAIDKEHPGEWFKTEQLRVLPCPSPSLNRTLNTFTCKLKIRNPKHNCLWVKDY